MPAPSLSIVIPAYNEERRLGATLEQVGLYLRKQRICAEILVVDDGSKDGTVTLARSLQRKIVGLKVLLNGHNMGKGASVRHGVMQAKGEQVLFSDADLSTPIEELEKLWPEVRAGRADFSIGSRGMLKSEVAVRQPLYRVMMGKSFNLLVQAVAVRGIMDTQCGFKLFDRKAGQKVFDLQRVPRFGFDVEMLFLARKMGYRIHEVPVRWVNSPFSTVNPIADSSQMFFDLLQIRLNDWQGKYKD
jgi:dolichyl-phosphate beta-glucosyltransferase